MILLNLRKKYLENRNAIVLACGIISIIDKNNKEHKCGTYTKNKIPLTKVIMCIFNYIVI